MLSDSAFFVRRAKLLKVERAVRDLLGLNNFSNENISGQKVYAANIRSVRSEFAAMVPLLADDPAVPFSLPIPNNEAAGRIGDSQFAARFGALKDLLAALDLCLSVDAHGPLGQGVTEMNNALRIVAGNCINFLWDTAPAGAAQNEMHMSNAAADQRPRKLHPYETFGARGRYPQTAM
jgi:hypothetical protein